MPRIAFHTHIANKTIYACRLVRKIVKAQRRAIVLTQNQQDLAQLDHTLWTFSELDFLPHVPAQHPLASRTPIILTDTDTVELPHYQILINLSDIIPRFLARCERVFEIVGMDEADQAAGRIRYRFYQQNGYLLNHVASTNTRSYAPISKQ